MSLIVIPTNVPGGGGSTIPGGGLLTEWPMDEGSGQGILDAESGLDGYLGTTSGTDATDPTRITEGLSFSGAQLVSIPSNWAFNLSGAFTLFVVFQTSDASAGGKQLLTRDSGATSGQRNWQFRSDGGVLKAVVFTSTSAHTNVTGTVNVANGAWHVGLVSFNGSALSIYVDGTLDNSTPLSTPMYVNSNAQNVTLGGRIDAVMGASEFIAGKIAYAGIYARCLSSTEISALQSSLASVLSGRGITL